MIYLQVWAAVVIVYLATGVLLSYCNLYFRPTQSTLLIIATGILAYSALSGGVL